MILPPPLYFPCDLRTTFYNHGFQSERNFQKSADPFGVTRRVGLIVSPLPSCCPPLGRAWLPMLTPPLSPPCRMCGWPPSWHPKRRLKTKCPTKVQKSASASTFEGIVEIVGPKHLQKCFQKLPQKLAFSENGETAIQQLFTTLQPCWTLPKTTPNR